MDPSVSSTPYLLHDKIIPNRGHWAKKLLCSTNLNSYQSLLSCLPLKKLTDLKQCRYKCQVRLCEGNLHVHPVFNSQQTEATCSYPTWLAVCGISKHSLRWNATPSILHDNQHGATKSIVKYYYYLITGYP